MGVGVMSWIKNWAVPIAIWATLSVLQSWICTKYTWETNLPIAVVTVLLIFILPIVNRWRMRAWERRQRFSAGLLIIAILGGEGYVLYTELGSWMAGRDMVARAAQAQEERRRIVTKTTEIDIAAAKPITRSSREVQADIKRELVKVVSAKRELTLGKATNDCTKEDPEYAGRCKKVLELTSELEGAKSAEEAAKNLRSSPAAPILGDSQTADPTALPRYLSTKFGGTVEDWGFAPLFVASVVVMIVRQASWVAVTSTVTPAVSLRQPLSREAPEERDNEEKGAKNCHLIMEKGDSAVTSQPIDVPPASEKGDKNCHLIMEKGDSAVTPGDALRDAVTLLYNEGVSIRAAVSRLEHLGATRRKVQTIYTSLKREETKVVPFRRS